MFTEHRSEFNLTRYDYDKVRRYAVRPNASKKSRMKLLRWMENFASDRDWNGEYWDISKDGDGLALFPIDKPTAFDDDGTPYEWETVDCEIKRA